MSTAAPWLNHQNSFALVNGLAAFLRAPAGGGVERLRLDQAVRLLPEADLVGVAEQPAVGDDAVLVRQLAGEERRLGGAGDGRAAPPACSRPSPLAARAFSRGACSSSRGVSPTALISTMGCIRVSVEYATVGCSDGTPHGTGWNWGTHADAAARQLGPAHHADRLRGMGHRRRRLGVRLGRAGRRRQRSPPSARAIDLGINWIDTAAVYGLGHSEEVVAKALEGVAEAAVRVHQVRPRVGRERGRSASGSRPTASARECEASLKRLKVDVIDLYQVHWPEPDEDIEEGWQTVVKLKEEGKVRWVGVSNFSRRADGPRGEVRADHVAPAAVLDDPPRGRASRSCRTARSTTSA